MKQLTPDEAILAAGGWGKYQTLVFLICALIWCQQGITVYCFDLFTLEPQIKCDASGRLETCKLDDICNNEYFKEVKWEIDWES